MKKWLISLVCLFFASTAHAGVCTHNVDKAFDKDGWNISVKDSDVDQAFELVTDLATTYAQIATTNYVEAYSVLADVTQYLTVYGIDVDGDQFSSRVLLDGTTGASVSTTKFMYVDRARLDSECAGRVVIQDDAGTFITSIATGVLVSGTAQHFPGEKVAYVTSWGATATATQVGVELELRQYPDEDDSNDSDTGYEVLDRLMVSSNDTNIYKNYASPLKIASDGWLAIFARSNEANGTICTTIQGYNK